MQLLAATTEDGWRPGIGDPTIMGWLTVAAYFIVAVLCLRAYKTARPPTIFDSGAITRIWLGLGLLFIALGTNKQLDLQSLLTQMARAIVREAGWYEHRRQLQAAFIIALVLGGSMAIIWLFWLTRHALKTYGLALAGAVFTITFVIVRAASFHRVDEMLGWTMLGVEMNWALELSGIACVGAGAALTIRHAAAERRRNQSLRDAHQRWTQTIRGRTQTTPTASSARQTQPIVRQHST